MIRFCLLGSGSSGNAILVASSNAKILIDNGLSFKQLRLRAEELGESLDDLKAVFITHEHIDHVHGVGILARRLKVPVYVTEKTYQNFPTVVGAMPDVRHFEAGEAVALDGIRLTSFSVCHDAADPVGYTIEADGVKLGIASDLGRVSQLVRNRLQGAHALLLESNYCPQMLQNGPYPVMLQQRIRSHLGHLSNADMNSLLADLLHDQLKIVVLVHLSEENNNPELAHEMAARVLAQHGAQLIVAQRHKPTGVFTVTP